MINLDQWLLPTLALLPVLGVSFLAAGVPWTLALLPRADRRDPVLVGALGLALGAALWTAGMFLLGTFATITVAGTVALGALVALAGMAASWVDGRRGGRPESPLSRATGEGAGVRIATWEGLILAGLIVALVLRVINVAYWPFTAYDPLWVYGYNARVFTLHGVIPPGMGYYPQLLPLTYTYAQMVWGGIDDHAARAAIPIFGLVSILAASLLGSRLFADDSAPARGRRIGLLAAALWAFYPHHAEWSHAGDLEVPLTAFFTLAALLFLLAWRAESGARWRYAILAGMLLGGALWTKPTAGALVWSIGLALAGTVGAEIVRARRAGSRPDVAYLRQRLALVVATGLAAIPLGGMWYIRNVLLGHPALVFPTGFWLTQAQRSGQELGWPLLGLALLAIVALLGPPTLEPIRRRAIAPPLLGGLALMIGAALNSAGLWVGTPTHRLTWIEVLVIGIGAVLYGLGIWRWRRGNLPMTSDVSPSPHVERGERNPPGLRRGEVRVAGAPDSEDASLIEVGPERTGHAPSLQTIGLMVALIAPYWLTWFWSYSYHPRLAFAITPLQLVILSVLAEAILGRLAPYVRPARRGWMAAIAAGVLMLPGLWLAIAKSAPHLLAADLVDDGAKQYAANPSLFLITEALRVEIEAAPDAAAVHVLAPGALRLPFFFPDVTIDTSAVTRLDDLDGVVTHYIDGTESENVYREEGPNQVRALPGRPDLAQLVTSAGDVGFAYNLYRVDTARRFQMPDCNALLDPAPVYPSFAEMLGYGITGLDFWDGRRIVVFTCWHVTDAIAEDYTVYMHVMDQDGNLVATWDHRPGGERYGTSLWQPGEFVKDELSVYLYDQDVPPGTYQVRMGLYDYLTETRIPVQVGGETLDGFLLIPEIRMLDHPLEE